MSDNNQTPSSSSPTLPRGLVSRRGGLVNPSARMPSLRSPRDLTLGGKPKKSFKPNIPVRKDRTREEPKDNSESSSSSQPKGRDKTSSRDGRGGRGRGRGRGRRQPETIQTHSIFEQGPMERANKGRGSSSYGGSGDSSFSSKAGGASSAGVRKFVKKDDMDDDGVLDDLLRDDFIDDPSVPKDDRYNPVHLPLTASLPKREMKETKEDKMEVDEEENKMDVDVKVKTEPGTTDTEMKDDKFVKPAPVAPLKSKVHTKKDSAMDKTTCADLFTSDSYDTEGELVFFQLPDTLPSFPSSTEEEERKPVIKQEKDAAGASGAQKESKEEKQNTCSLKDLPEGYLGKLQVLKSGKARLVLGNVTLDVSMGSPCGFLQVLKSGKARLVLGNVILDVSMGSPCGFLQDLVSVQLGGEKGGELITLGHINHRVVCTPDFEQLLQSGS